MTDSSPLNNTYKPCSKPNNEINYMHKESTHPLSIIKQVPFSIKSRLSSLSSSEKIFKESMLIYQKALKKIWMRQRITAESVRPSSSHDTQTIENLLKTENTKQTLNFLMKSGN